MQSLSTSLDDALLPNLDKAVHLPNFEGPLDLLLFLIRKNEIDIYDIPIERITQQYLTIIYSMDQTRLELAGEFFLMASTLMYIKSRMLLPQGQEGPQDGSAEEALDPRWELVEQLLAYKKYKAMALQLEQSIAQKEGFVKRIYQEPPLALEDRPLKSLDKIELWGVFNQILRRLADRIHYGRLEEDAVTVSDRMEHVLHYIQKHPSFLFTDCLPQNMTLSGIIATFLAVLELCRLKKLALSQDDIFADIHCLAQEEILEKD
jgi:segregation and condensation protein A